MKKHRNIESDAYDFEASGVSGMMKKYGHWAFFPISIFYCELWLRIFSGEMFF